MTKSGETFSSHSLETVIQDLTPTNCPDLIKGLYRPKTSYMTPMLKHFKRHQEYKGKMRVPVYLFSSETMPDVYARPEEMGPNHLSIPNKHPKQN